LGGCCVKAMAAAAASETTVSSEITPAVETRLTFDAVVEGATDVVAERRMDDDPISARCFHTRRVSFFWNSLQREIMLSMVSDQTTMTLSSRWKVHAMRLEM
jgi:hypothetical protein